MIETCPDFNLVDAFRLLDRDGRGSIDALNIRNAFEDSEVLDLPQMTQEDVELFIARYDRDNDRKISFLEFSMAFSPIDPFYKEKLVGRRGSNYELANKTLLMYRNLWIT